MSMSDIQAVADGVGGGGPQAQGAPAQAVAALDRLVGTWRVSGEALGTVTYAWMEGGFFLRQDVELVQDGRRVCGVEIIGKLQPFGRSPSEDVHSRFYDNAGNTFDYVYELTDDTLRIWAGEKGSPAFYEGRFAADGTVVDGAWTYPGGGGYSSTMTRVAS
jgi:hypothetical protein